MNLKEEIGRRLADARGQRELTLDAVVDMLKGGLTRTTLHSYERGSRTLPIAIAKRLAPIYGVTAAYLLTVEDQAMPKGLEQISPQERQLLNDMADITDFLPSHAKELIDDITTKGREAREAIERIRRQENPSERSGSRRG